MKKVSLKLESDSYEVHIGSGILRSITEQLDELGTSGKVVVITNPVVKDLYGDNLGKNLARGDFHVFILTVPDGEDQKSLESAEKLYGELTQINAERLTPIIALGGGVIGDLAGFVAATYLRGVPFIQIPTTLIAQVDSSIGGKVGINYGQLKNRIGAFYQPKLVITDTSTLKSLPEKTLVEGLAEVIKYAIIWDKDFFNFLEENLAKIKLLDEEVIEQIVFRSATIKAKVVEIDEKETGLRRILNYGHTVGHAVETVSDFHIQHGAAVAIGMVAAGRIANKLGAIDDSDLARMKNLIERAGLPTEISNVRIDEIMQAMAHDKKVQKEKITFILPKAIGEVFTTDEVTPSLINQVLVG